jgi:hypothetical protein
MENILPGHKRPADLRRSAYELREALGALFLEHALLSDVYQAVLQTHTVSSGGSFDSYEYPPRFIEKESGEADSPL